MRSPAAPLDASTVTAGQRLDPWIVDVTPSLVIAGALATRDAQDVHHDLSRAKARGFKDVFMNNFTTMGLVTRYVTDWAGPLAFVESFAFKLGRPQYPDDALRFSGEVTSVEHAASGWKLGVKVVGDNGLGNHVTCTLALRLPL